MAPHIPRGPIGFRLAHELEGILQGITADGVITAEEHARLRRWLAANQEFREIRPFSELADHIEAALADGVLTIGECDDLLFLTGKYTTVNPHFDSLRAGVQVLMGMLTGIVADHVVDEREARELFEWGETWAHLQGIWPYDECHGIVTRVLAHNRLQEDGQYLTALAAQFPIAGHVEGNPAPPPLITGVCAVDPTITFPDRCFVMTGESKRAKRSDIGESVVALGGTFSDSVTRETDYLIVCDNGCPCWAFSCYGRKVEKAYNLRRQGHRVLLVQESDFWDAMLDAGVSFT